MKTLRLLIVAAALLLAVGCESFRSDDGSAKSEKSSAKSGRSGRRSRNKGKRDPRDDMFFGLGGAKAESFSNDHLSEREQTLLDGELKRQDEEMRDMRRLHRDLDTNRSKRKEWVYGFKPLGGDK